MIDSFDRVRSQGMEWTMMKIGILDFLDRSAIYLYTGAKMRVNVASELSEHV